ncbi:MAG: tRNA 2-thiouridine(34) synthase MnmA [Eubacteriaceae bacterium]|nr:tRNA 2-thiouridine(34) synthase MnmA [Eubacteriaceae bacterium]
MSQIVCGMSGGVDSSVAAFLLKEQGHDVIGAFMRNWDEEGCPAAQDYEDAKSVCIKLGIPLYSVDFTKEYKERVFSYFLEEYGKNRTPNPDILCNSEIKFKCFHDYASNALGAEFIATGHYAKIDKTGSKARLLKAKDTSKDQTYFLSYLSQEQLARSLFPLGDMLKTEVRQIADKLSLATAGKKDSTGICFIGERNFREFLMNYFPATPGDIVDISSGRILGKHIGLVYYTIAQRKGLGIGGIGNGQPWFVCNKDPGKNTLFVAQGPDHPALFSSGFASESSSFIAGAPLQKSFSANVKYRYMQKEVPADIKTGKSGDLAVTFQTRQKGLAPGQYGVFYVDDECIGGAQIDNILN